MEQEIIKKEVGYKAADLIQDGMLVGIGTGSTVFFFIERLIERVKSGLRIKAVSSSIQSQNLASAGGVPLVDINLLSYLDITVDGADEIDSQKRMIKGGGGALLREKILASMSKEMVVVIDESKLCHKLGKHKLPVEVVSFASEVTAKKIERLGYMGTFRKTSSGQKYITDNGNFIFDIHFPSLIENPEEEELKLKSIPGVVETGFFFRLAGRVIVGFKDGQVATKP